MAIARHLTPLPGAGPSYTIQATLLQGGLFLFVTPFLSRFKAKAMVIPAEAGIQSIKERPRRTLFYWMLVFTSMTK
ncbi:MAG: hypothetical protein WD750_00835 [Gammaproteobacteria bacterium]